MKRKTNVKHNKMLLIDYMILFSFGSSKYTIALLKAYRNEYAIQFNHFVIISPSTYNNFALCDCVYGCKYLALSDLL